MFYFYTRKWTESSGLFTFYLFPKMPCHDMIESESWIFKLGKNNPHSIDEMHMGKYVSSVVY